MPESNQPSTSAPATPAQVEPPVAIPGPTIRIGEEFGTAKKNLPPRRSF